MKYLFECIRKDPNSLRAIERCKTGSGQSQIYGVTGTQKHTLLASCYYFAPQPFVIITGGNEAMEPLRADLSALLPNVDILIFPAVDMITFTAEAKSVELAARRMNILARIARGEKVIVIASAESATQKVLAFEDFATRQITLETGSIVKLNDLLTRLVEFGYERVDQVQAIGQFSVRGGIIDIFPVNRDLPLRLELFGDEVDSLREFDTVDQRSRQNISVADIVPLTEPENSGKQTVFLNYLPAKAMVVFDEPARIRESITKMLKENPEVKRRVFGWTELIAAAQTYSVLYLSLMLQKIPGSHAEEIISITAKSVAPFHRQVDMLITELKNWQQRGFVVVIYVSNRDKAIAMQGNFVNEGIHAVYTEKPSELTPGAVLITPGVLTNGFELSQARLLVITEMDIFGRQKKRQRPRVAAGQQITYFRDINVGDYVVHANHGVGKYVGVETLTLAGVHKDYLHIRYAGQDKLYVPTDQVHLLQKYIGAEGETPRLHKMGGTEWVKAKSKAKAAVADMAKELVSLYAERQITSGYAFDPDTPWQKEFEEAFSYEETPDQLTAIAEIKADMEKPRPMDRLLCGDVGFGKTEVAIRAAFKAVMSGKQVAVLVPTTVLAQQHYQTFSARFAGFGPTVDVISRFRTAKEQRATVDKLANGQIDILIGTHRILQADVTFKDIGLLIVDEEQRFGVAQKERLKKWRANIDVLTLSATPIPRTLHMSLVGARDMSIIETPPEERFPVQTYVVEYHDDIIRDAIKRELKRGGQVYYVHNRVQNIDKVHRELAQMLPDAKIKTGHGQMPEEMLEQVMLDFYEGHDDVLLCSSIIENGLDVANANTIIICDADRFGLSQLYQMRGRVGRSRRLAFAYFTYRRDKVLSEIAEKRLQAIKEFTELGAGFKIAMRDLEIRGAGNLLGAEQHGNIVSVGFEMYCRLLDEAVQELKTGKVFEPPVEPVLELIVEAYLNGDYISDAMHKIEIYQRIAAVRNEEHITNLLDELIDRFGEPSEPVVNLLAVARIKNMARQLGVRSIVQHPADFQITFGDNANIAVDHILAMKTKYLSRVNIAQGPPAHIRIKTAKIAENSLLKLLTGVLSVLIGNTENNS